MEKERGGEKGFVWKGCKAGMKRRRIQKNRERAGRERVKQSKERNNNEREEAAKGGKM